MNSHTHETHAHILFHCLRVWFGAGSDAVTAAGREVSREVSSPDSQHIFLLLFHHLMMSWGLLKCGKPDFQTRSMEFKRVGHLAQRVFFCQKVTTGSNPSIYLILLLCITKIEAIKYQIIGVSLQNGLNFMAIILYFNWVLNPCLGPLELTLIFVKSYTNHFSNFQLHSKWPVLPSGERKCILKHHCMYFLSFWEERYLCRFLLLGQYLLPQSNRQW